MLKLVAKEFLVQKRSLLQMLVYVLFLFVVFGLSGGSEVFNTYQMAGTATGFMFVQYGCAHDEKNKSEIILNSLPLSRGDIVRAKYLAGILYFPGNLLYIAAAGLVLSRLPYLRLQPIGLTEAIATVTLPVILSALYLPFFFRYGYIRAKFFNLFIFYVFFFGPNLLLNYVAAHPELPAVLRFTELLRRISPWGLAGAAVAIAAAIMLLSLAASIAIYRRREFC